jgi:chemotaxis protein CheX
MITDVENLVSDAVNEVFTTMLSFPIQRETPKTEATNGEPHIAGSVGFIGRLTGIVYIYSTCRLAKKITAQLVGMTETEITGEEMVNDAFGELANMVVGQLKSRLCDRGMPCVLTIPSIVRGSHFSIEPVSSTERGVLSFRCLESQVIVEVLLKANRANN